jgi:endonuclease/exonuclease/phosphatase family metal-dependent hydrolase
LRIASFNVENLFDRARAMKLAWKDGREILDRYARINQLLNKPVYTDEDKTEIKDLLRKLGLAKKDDGGKYAELRQIRGRLLRRPKTGGVEITATGRPSWIGWVELKSEPVDGLAMEHTAMVIRDVAADIVGVVEAENRIVLDKFSAPLLKKIGGDPYPHVMVIDGNDDRGIDVGLMTRVGYDLVTIRSHVDDTDAKGEIFSRDCPEFLVTTPTGARLVVLVNHFKSKGYGRAADSNDRRKRQAARTAEIYQRLLADGEENVVVLGDLNDTPDSDPLSPLFAAGLRDVSEHSTFSKDPKRPGTYGNGTKGQKIDYVLLSPALFGLVTGGRIFRTGVWGGKNGTLWPHYPKMTAAVHAASDHAAINI